MWRKMFVVLMVFCAVALFAQIPKTMNYQGKLTNSSGVGLDGTYNLLFRIYNDSTGGTELWSEMHSPVNVTKGLFDVVLGSDSLLDLPFDTQYWLEIQVNGETMTPRIPLSSVGYSFRAAIADSVAGGVPSSGVTSLNSLTGDLDITGEGGIEVSASGSEISVNLTLESGDCPNIVDLTGGSVTNQYVPTNLQTFSQSIGQFIVLGSEMGCTGGRIYRITLYTNLSSGTVPDVDVWLDNVYTDNLSAGSIPPSGSPDVANATLTINGDGSIVIDLPHGFLYTGNNILITMRKNSTSGIGALWMGYNTSPSITARYNESAATFPLPSTASSRPNIKFDFTAPELPDIVTNVNGITDTVTILGGTDIGIVPDVPNHTITVNYTGTGGGENILNQDTTMQNADFWISGHGHFGGGGATILYNWDFSDLTDWTITNIGTCPDGWRNDNPGGRTSMTEPFLIADSDNAGSGCGRMNTYAESIPMDFSGYSEIALEINHYFKHMGTQLGEIEAWNGSAWINVATYNSDVGPTTEIFNISPIVAGVPDAKIRFHFDDNDEWDWYWIIENATIYDGIPSGEVDIYSGNISAEGTVDIEGDAYINGNVGIGTDSPLEKLQVDGTALISGGATYGVGIAGRSNAATTWIVGDIGVTGTCEGTDEAGVAGYYYDGSDFDRQGLLGAEGYGAYAQFDSLNYAYLGTDSMGIYASGTHSAGYFDGVVRITDTLYVPGINLNGTYRNTWTGGGGGFQQLRANGSVWLTDSVTFAEGSNITLTQTGDSIIIAAIGGAGDDWGSQVVQHNATLSGDGTSGNPLKIAQQGASSGQVLKWNGSTWSPADDIGGGSGDNLGNHTATMDLNMSNYNIDNCDNLYVDDIYGNTVSTIDFYDDIDMNDYNINGVDNLYVKDIYGSGVSTIDFYNDIDMNSYGIILGGVRRTSWPTGGTDNDWGYLSGSGLSGTIYHSGNVAIGRSSWGGYGDLEVGDSYSNFAIMTEGYVEIDANGVSSFPAALYAYCHNSYYGVWGRSSGGIGVYGYGSTYDFYAGGSGTNYGPFTGAHEVKIIPEETDVIKKGMIVSVTGENKFRIENGDTSISSTLASVKLSNIPNDKSVFGVFVMKCPLPDDHWYFADSDSTDLKSEFGIVNAVGEGRVLVTNINGEVEKGDLITTSLIPGYGQKQNDDLIHSYTVGKVIETVDWKKVETEILFRGKRYKAYLVAVVYMCG